MVGSRSLMSPASRLVINAITLDRAPTTRSDSANNRASALFQLYGPAPRQALYKKFPPSPNQRFLSSFINLVDTQNTGNPRSHWEMINRDVPLQVCIRVDQSIPSVMSQTSRVTLIRHLRLFRLEMTRAYQGQTPLQIMLELAASDFTTASKCGQ